jgi:hypothetical protein
MSTNIDWLQTVEFMIDLADFVTLYLVVRHLKFHNRAVFVEWENELCNSSPVSWRINVLQRCEVRFEIQEVCFSVHE